MANNSTLCAIGGSRFPEYRYFQAKVSFYGYPGRFHDPIPQLNVRHRPAAQASEARLVQKDMTGVMPSMPSLGDHAMIPRTRLVHHLAGHASRDEMVYCTWYGYVCIGGRSAPHVRLGRASWRKGIESTSLTSQHFTSQLTKRAFCSGLRAPFKSIAVSKGAPPALIELGNSQLDTPFERTPLTNEAFLQSRETPRAGCSESQPNYTYRCKAVA